MPLAEPSALARKQSETRIKCPYESQRATRRKTAASTVSSNTGLMIAILVLCLSPIFVGQHQTPSATDPAASNNTNTIDQISPATSLANTCLPGSGAFPICFTYNPAVPVVNNPVTFNATASGGTAPYTFFWNFGDGSNGTANPITHTYTSLNAFCNSISCTVKLNVTDATGAFAVAAATIKLQIDTTVAAFCWTPTTVFAGEQTFFDASGTTCPGSSDSIGQIVSYSWNFGDGTTGKGIATLHTYSSPGVYQVTLSVTDNSGVTVVKPLALWARPALSLTIWANSTAGFAPLFVSFNSTVSGGQSPYTYSWDFGDGSVSTHQAPIHNYTISRLYRVGLTVTDFLGHAATKYLNITVAAIPVQPAYLGISQATLQLGGILTAVSILPLTIFAVVRRRK